MKVRFEWDRGNLHKAQGHGLTIAEIENVFAREVLIRLESRPQFKDLAEKRFIAVGTNERGRGIFVAFTLREKSGETFLRVISARYMHQKEWRRYEELKKTSK